MNIRYCTITGADDATQHTDMQHIQQKYPFVEWGLLVGSNPGTARWPSNAWMADLNKHAPTYCGVGSPPYLRRTIHLCGVPLRELLLGRIHDRFMPYAMMSAMRHGKITVQMNTHGERHDVSNAGIELIKDLGIIPIVQMDNVHVNLFTSLRKAVGRDLRAIFDLSHGAGITPAIWPFPIEGTHCTYAGGLSPDNLNLQLERIAEVAGEAEVSIDMETHVRTKTNAGDVLDMDKVERCLIAARNYWRA